MDNLTGLSFSHPVNKVGKVHSCSALHVTQRLVSAERLLLRSPTPVSRSNQSPCTVCISKINSVKTWLFIIMDSVATGTHDIELLLYRSFYIL